MLSTPNVSSSTLLSVSQASGATVQTGVSYRLRPVTGDEVNNANQTFKFYATTQFNGGATTPTGQVKVQGSVDGTNWIDIALGATQTADDATRTEMLADVANQAVLPYVRAITVLAGGTAPTKQIVTVSVVSSGDFTLVAA